MLRYTDLRTVGGRLHDLKMIPTFSEMSSDNDLEMPDMSNYEGSGDEVCSEISNISDAECGDHDMPHVLLVEDNDQEILYTSDEDSNDEVQSGGTSHSSSSDDETATDAHSDCDRTIDIEEELKCREFLDRGCGCQLNNGTQCSSLYQIHELIVYRADFMQLSKDNQEIAILSAIRTGLAGNRCLLSFKGKRVCIKMFRGLHGIGERRMKSLIKYMKQYNTLSPRMHGNVRRMPANTIPFEEICSIKLFIQNYAAFYGCELPGRHPGFRSMKVTVLDTSITKYEIWDFYAKCCPHANKRAVCYTSFIQLWNKLCPYVMIAKPKTDLCNTCQGFYLDSKSTANAEEGVKLAQLNKQQEHLYRSEREKLVYKRQCQEAAKEHEQCAATGRQCRFRHLSFDFAQQVLYPDPPMQPGGLFFLTPRKCGLFGICNDAIHQQINFLIDECVNIGKGPNTIISLLHFYVEKYCIGIRTLFMHADNCVGQNKNNYVMMYLLWRVLTGRSTELTLSFMIAGHTKFSCDACFGLIKKVVKRTFISSLVDIAECVDKSGEHKSTNIVELVGLENGYPLIHYFEWQKFLTRFFNKLPKIKPYHYFRAAQDLPIGTMELRLYSDSEPEYFNILKQKPGKDLFPERIYPLGLSKERKAYLHKEIRPYCRRGTEDLVAPDVA